MMFGIGLSVLFLWKPPSSSAADNESFTKIKNLWKFIAAKGMCSCGCGVIDFSVWLGQRLWTHEWDKKLGYLGTTFVEKWKDYKESSYTKLVVLVKQSNARFINSPPSAGSSCLVHVLPEQLANRDRYIPKGAGSVTRGTRDKKTSGSAHDARHWEISNNHFHRYW